MIKKFVNLASWRFLGNYKILFFSMFFRTMFFFKEFAKRTSKSGKETDKKKEETQSCSRRSSTKRDESEMRAGCRVQGGLISRHLLRAMLSLQFDK